ncbi:M28 family metallopeptidase [Myxococcus virescens]|uniref:Peptidase family M28 n=1 Tax=Myxococcus virescens TaxID=83456 RepID=A0ABY0MMD6_9BACT|nr:M28 family peptidase [Myxococcus virescens]SDD79181.1 Peptidase family M28 [Myxococcus virescens]
MATKVSDSPRPLPSLPPRAAVAKDPRAAESPAKPASAPPGWNADRFESSARAPRPLVCTVPTPPPTAPVEPAPAPEPEVDSVAVDSDPMTHIAYLSSDELQGRDSPSAGLDAASLYVQQHVQKYGLVGPNTNNPDNAFEQRFDVYSFAGRPGVRGESGEHAHTPSTYGHALFEGGFYLDDNMPKETLALLNQQYEKSMNARGLPLAPPREGARRSVEELRQLASPSGQAVNTMALLPGSGPNKDEVIVVMAHLDHDGVDRRGNVLNGADDNASGSAVLMAAVPELAEAARRGELDRSVLFLWTGAEEKGLVGSQYFVDHPIPGLGMEEIAGVINVDMVGRWDDQRLSVVDTNSRGQPNYFRDVLDQANAKLDDPFDRINRDINVFRDRQDGASFGRKGEDVLFMFEGLSNPNGGGDLIPEYHRADDDIDLIVRDNGGEKPRRIKDLMVNVIGLAANRTTEP